MYDIRYPQKQHQTQIIRSEITVIMDFAQMKVPVMVQRQHQETSLFHLPIARQQEVELFPEFSKDIAVIVA